MNKHTRYTRNILRSVQPMWFPGLMILSSLFLLGMMNSVKNQTLRTLETIPSPIPEVTETEPVVAPEDIENVLPVAPASEVSNVDLENAFKFTARMSHYDPRLGGTNCFLFRNGYCLSAMSSGEKWEAWIDGRMIDGVEYFAAACPKILPFWTRIILPGGEQGYCLDRGSAIVQEKGGAIWLDLLVTHPPVPFGTYIYPVHVIYP